MAQRQSKDSFLRSLACNFDYEEAAYAAGATRICGLDECGVGCWFSVVTGGACILPRDCKIVGLRDSKNLFTILMLDIARMQKSDLRAVPRAVIVGDGAKKILSKRYQSRTV